MYRAALIQNESEMLRYGWADIRPLLEDKNKGDDLYEWLYFGTDNINDLFGEVSMGRLDAIVIATNACNDVNVRDFLRKEENRESIRSFVESGGGLFVSLQMRLSAGDSYGFLPHECDVRLVNRPELGTDGEMRIAPGHQGHVLFQYPRVVNLNDIVARCLSNEFAHSLYRGYLEPLDDAFYEVLVSDDTYAEPRPLMLCSRADYPGRIVVTSIPVDWQGHRHILENAIRYVVEGQPKTAVIERRGRSDADFQYLVANLKVSKIPYSRYVQDQLEFSKLHLDLHDTVILDPSWTHDDLMRSDYHAHFDLMEPGARLFFFSLTPFGDPVLSRLGGIRNLDIVRPETIAWIRSQYADGRWGESFWNTFDVLESLAALGMNVQEYETAVLCTVAAHNIEGSYDEVIGATCALLKLYSLFDRRDSKDFRCSLSWLKPRLPDAVLYERAAILETLQVTGVGVDDSIRQSFLNECRLLDASRMTELDVHRYSRTLLSLGYVEDALALARSAKDSQESSGKWVNAGRTASMVLLLMEIQERQTSPGADLDEMIFKGVTFLKGEYDGESCSWHNDAPLTAKSLRALAEFERRVSYPIDELIGTFRGFEELRGRSRAIERVSRRNAGLEGENTRLKQAAEKAAPVQRFSSVYSMVLTAIAVPCFGIGVLFFAHVLKDGKGSAAWGYFSGFIGAQAVAASVAIATTPFVALYLLARFYGYIPTHVEVLPKGWEKWILRLARGSESKESAQ
ncbi:MAG: hypothetical protein U1E22_00835 [Coriobacteriia bacterium]|nr:hypothetical protein [Coriobacteriia bacterium]